MNKEWKLCFIFIVGDSEGGRERERINTSTKYFNLFFLKLSKNIKNIKIKWETERRKEKDGEKVYEKTKNKLELRAYTYIRT